jgi:hypothetical protein
MACGEAAAAVAETELRQLILGFCRV